MSHAACLIAGLLLLQPAVAHTASPSPQAVEVESFISPPQQIRMADPAVLRQQATIHYGDLDLATPEGARAMFARIQRSAELVCSTPDERDGRPVDYAGQRSCKADVMAAALARLDNPRVAAVGRRPGDLRRAMRVALAR